LRLVKPLILGGFFLFDWFKTKTIDIDDPYFGRLTSRSDNPSRWSGKLSTRFSSSPISIHLDVGSTGPTEEHRRMIQELLSRLPDLESKIEERLYELWINLVFDESFEQYASIDAPHKMTEIVELGGIALDADNSFSLQYEFKKDSLPEASLFVDIVNWEPLAGCVVD